MRVLISVSNKSGIVEFASGLVKLGAEIISTGGTAKILTENNIPVVKVSEITNFPECLDGRVKTLHPMIHGGILARRDNPEHMEQLKQLNITPLDMIVVNLYPFKETIAKDNVTFEEAIENIDIGGPTMLRSAAKNFKDVAVITDPNDYNEVLSQIEVAGSVSYDTKYKLALKVFEHTCHYDTLIAKYLKDQANLQSFSDTLTLTFEKVQDLRYGENPHQNAVFYKEVGQNKGALSEAKQLHGKELSFNNINDTNGAIEILKEYKGEPTIVAVKHANPCGIGSSCTLLDAYNKAYESDPVSIFGGIIASNTEIDAETAEQISKIFIEIIVAPSFSPKALEILTQKKNIRLLELSNIEFNDYGYDYKRVLGGLLIQERDQLLMNDDLEIVTDKKPTKKEMNDLIFAWKAVKNTKSNGISIAKDKTLIANGPGQVSRIWAVENSIKQGGDSVEGAVMASDAFFPFDDCVKVAAEAGITAIIQPGGSARDDDSIKACNELGVAMVFTGVRHFKH